jgi:hypothetical protein
MLGLGLTLGRFRAMVQMMFRAHSRSSFKARVRI